MLITSDDIRVWSQVDFDAAGYGLATPDPLDVLVVQARAYVQEVTGRLVADLDAEDDLGVLMQQAVRMRVEQLLYQQAAEAVAAATDESVVTSFSVPGYSESRSLRTGAAEGQRPRVNVWPLLDDLLWLLMTDEKREWWLSHLRADAAAPAFALQEVDWNRGDDVGSAPSSWPGWGWL